METNQDALGGTTRWDRGRTCSSEDCKAPHKARGLCGKHYEKLRIQEWSGTCRVPDCGAPVKSTGLCSMHYSRSRKGIPLDAEVRYQRTTRRGECKLPSCPAPDLHRGYCKRHYSLVNKYRMTDPQALALLEVKTCPICGSDDNPMVIDHNHSCCPDRSRSCGECIRGAICSYCNSGLGYFQDKPAILQKAARYLARV